MRTRELFWKRALDRFEAADAVAWALERLGSVPGTPALSTLAVLVKPYNAFEVDALLRDALQELNLKEPVPEDGYRDFVCAHVSDILAGRMSESDACERLADPYRVDLSRRELQPFCLLHWAVNDYCSSDVFLTRHGDGQTADLRKRDRSHASVSAEARLVK